MEHFQREHLCGIVEDAHEKFQLRFDYSKDGNPFLIGAKIVSTINLPNGGTMEMKTDIRAFGEAAEQLAHIQVGDEVYVEGTKGFRSVEGKDGKKTYYPIVTVDKVHVA